MRWISSDHFKANTVWLPPPPPRLSSFLLLALTQLVESKFLWKLHDLHNNEADTGDGIHLVPSGLDSILHVKSQQYAMHCDAIKEEIKLVMSFITFQQTSLEITSGLIFYLN